MKTNCAVKSATKSMIPPPPPRLTRLSDIGSNSLLNTDKNATFTDKDTPLEGSETLDFFRRYGIFFNILHSPNKAATKSKTGFFRFQEDMGIGRTFVRNDIFRISPYNHPLFHLFDDGTGEILLIERYAINLDFLDIFSDLFLASFAYTRHNKSPLNGRLLPRHLPVGFLKSIFIFRIKYLHNIVDKRRVRYVQ